MADAYDVHIGYPPPARWDKLPEGSVRLHKLLGGTGVRPTITSEQFDWGTLGLMPRWVGEDSSGAVAAIEPNRYMDRGATEWTRFITGAHRRGEVALAVSMIGHPRPAGEVSFRGVLGGSTEGVDLPGAAAGSGSVGGFRTPLAVAPTIADGLGRADRDLALRLVNTRDIAMDWWTLTRHATQLHHGAGGPVQVVQPDGSLQPLLVTGAGEVVAAVWISPDEQIRHYIIPWMPSWATILDWLAQKAIPEFVPSAARRIRANLGDDPALQTDAEAAALAAQAELEENYRVQREQIEQSLHDARSVADQLRHDLLYGRGTILEYAVSAVFADVGITVIPLDTDLRSTASTDLLVEYQGRRRLVEVKSASGNPAEKLVGDALKHVDTWPALRPGVEVEGISLVINHQINIHPTDRAQEAYSRPEFVQSLTIPVITTMTLFDAWRRRDFDAIRSALFADAPPGAYDSAVAQGPPSVSTAPEQQRWWWPWRRRPT
ncbi:MAG: hypothetical protein JST91_03115 [Actinobacteria bacterium]|nr:hypothetical protein [Actinomycetota bacterium]